jgi:hypothetical protein
MIKKFQSFNEELKPETYMSAAKSFDRLKGLHSDRARKLKKYADNIIVKRKIEEKEKSIEKVQEIGTFSLRVGINRSQSDVGFDEDISRTFYKIDSSRNSNDFWIYQIDIDDDFTEALSYDDVSPDEIPWELKISFWCVPKEKLCFEARKAFVIFVPIDWSRNSDNELVFTINEDRPVDIKIMYTHANERGATFHFIDRPEAVRFKKVYFKKETFEKLMESLDGEFSLKEIFMAYSTAEEYNSFFSKIQTLRVNLLYQ